MRVVESIISIILILLLAAFPLAQGSSVDVTVSLSKYSYVTFLISPLEETVGITLSIVVSYKQPNSNGSNTSVNIFSASVLQTQQGSKYSIWNFESVDHIIDISVGTNSGVNLTYNILTVSPMHSPSIFTAAFDKDTSSGYMLPFNMINQKTLQMYVVAYNATNQQLTYNLQPFMSTYWTEIQSSIQLLPHFPYFSKCSFEKSFIMLNDIIEPQKCQINEFYGILCDDKQFDFDCIIEQLEVSNVDAQFWFNKNMKILFYLFQNKLSMEDYFNLGNNLVGVNTLISNQFESLVPVFYQRYSSDQIIVNEFQVFFKTTIDVNSHLKIVYAEIKGYFNKDIISPNALIHIHISYLNIYQRFDSYDLGLEWYICYAIFIDVVFISCIYLVTTKICKFNIKQKIQIILAPAIKGCLYTFTTGGIFFLLINEISYQTNYNTITALFGETLTNESLEMNNIGRSGLAICFIGLYLLISSIKQAGKVSSSEQLKIVFEDHSRLEKKNLQSEQQLEQKIEFTKKNMVSHKKYMLISNLLVIFIGLFYIEIITRFSNWETALLTVCLIPFVSKIFMEQLKYLIMKELLYIIGNLVGILLAFNIIIFKNRSLTEFTYLYLCRYLNIYVEIFFVEIAFQKIIVKIDKLNEENRLCKLLSKVLKPILQFRRNESEYERVLYLSSVIVMQMLGVLMMPLMFLTFYLLERSNLLATNLLMEEISMNYALVMMIIFIPLEIFTIFATIQIIKKLTGLRIEEVIKFNRFKFKRRKFRWMNDEFADSKNIKFFYREYEKFAFSSQLYFVVSLMGYSVFLIYIGVIFIIQSSYLFGNDPVVFILLIIVVIMGDVLSIVVSFAAVKLKLYEKREEETMRQNLIKTEKYLKDNDITKFLQLEGVKDYFLLYNKDWIIQNLHKIFEKEDFEENNGELITKYKHYKSIFKRQEIQQKRRMKKLKQSQIVNNTTENVIQNRITFNKKEFTLLTKPIVFYWFYLAKQNLYLKNIINCVKKEKIKKNCQFCNMDFELEALQKRDFKELVNQFRVLNVSKIFDCQSFLEFYRINQKYITICIECKEKNLHLENRITFKEISSKLVKRWHFMAKSNLLHRTFK